MGALFAFFAGTWLDVPSDLRPTFAKLMLGQAALSALYQATRMVSSPFYLHHRQDLGNISQMGLFVVYYVVLHIAFAHGMGIYSMLVSQAAGFLWVVPFGYYHCRKHGYYPLKGTWGLPEKDEWLSVWRYSRDQLLIQFAALILMGLPQLLITRFLGLDAAALWAVCTRPFTILRQTFMRPFNVALPMLTDMFVNGNMQGVSKRWGDVTQIVLAISVCGYAVAAANNSLFVSLWTHGKIAWAEANNWMTAGYYIAYAAAGLSYGTIGLSKRIGNQRYVPVLQAIITAAMGLTAVRWWGMPGLIAACALPFLFCMTVAGVRYLAGVTHLPVREFSSRGFLRASVLVPLAVAIAWGASYLQPLLPGYFGLLLSASIGFGCSLGVAILIGVDPGVRTELVGMVTRPFRRFLKGNRPATQA
jgi:O-antigen/teichoic acid export membrane protein